MRETTIQLQHRSDPAYEAAGGPGPHPRHRPCLHHVQLKTARLDEMIAWYGLALGLVVGHKGSGAAWLTNDDANHRLALLSTDAIIDDPDRISHAGLHHTAWEYSSLDQLLESYEDLREHGILPHRTVDHGPILSFYYLDPDGNSVELQVDNYGDWTRSAEFFATEEFARDPFGPGVDPEKLIEARRAGLSHQDIHARSYRGEYPNERPNDRRLQF